jgi:release factor glutamine methyltransferase
VAGVGELLREAAARLPGAEARAEAEILLAHALGVSRSWLYAHDRDRLDQTQVVRFREFLRRREIGEPVAYLTGRRGFRSIELAVDSSTLIPRAETELLVELALQRLPDGRPARVLDLGTGSGAIALALAGERSESEVTAVDASAAALAVAARNAARLGLARVRLLRSDWYSAVADERFDLILSNPPYLAEDDPHLRQGDLRFEPSLALASGRDGLDAIRRIVASAPAHLNAGGGLLVEHGFEQGAAVRELFASAGFSQVETARDLEQRERVTCGELPA